MSKQICFKIVWGSAETLSRFFKKEIQVLSLNIKNSGKGFTLNLCSLYFVSENEEKMSHFANKYICIQLLEVPESCFSAAFTAPLGVH